MVSAVPLNAVLVNIIFQFIAETLGLQDHTDLISACLDVYKRQPIAVLAAGTTLTGCTANSSVQCAAADITLTGCTINRKSDDSTVLWLSKYDDSNTADVYKRQHTGW